MIQIIIVIVIYLIMIYIGYLVFFDNFAGRYYQNAIKTPLKFALFGMTEKFYIVFTKIIVVISILVPIIMLLLGYRPPK